jgi:hypothetical protein
MASQVEEFLSLSERECFSDVLFQQDEPPAHFHIEMADFLNHSFSEKQIGMGGPVTWPPRSPDLIPFIFSF